MAQQRDRHGPARKRRFEQAKHVVAWLIWAAKVYGVKAVTPAASAWKWGKDASSSTNVYGYNSSRRAKSSQAWRKSSMTWACPIHFICTATTSAHRATSDNAETMKVLEAIAPTWPICNFTPMVAMTGTPLRSEATPNADYFNKQRISPATPGGALWHAVTIPRMGHGNNLLYH